MPYEKPYISLISPEKILKYKKIDNNNNKKSNKKGNFIPL